MTKAKLNIFGRVFVEYLIEGVVGGGGGGGGGIFQDLKIPENLIAVVGWRKFYLIC